MRSATAKLRQQEMGSIRELEPYGDQSTVDFDADVPGKLKNKARPARLNIGTAANPCSTIRNNSAEPRHDKGLVFAQERGQVENFVSKRIGHMCANFEYTSLVVLIGSLTAIFSGGTGTSVRRSGYTPGGL